MAIRANLPYLVNIDKRREKYKMRTTNGLCSFEELASCRYLRYSRRQVVTQDCDATKNGTSSKCLCDACVLYIIKCSASKKEKKKPSFYAERRINGTGKK